MEDFPLLVLFFIIYLIAGSSGKKKNKRKSRQGPMRTRAQGEQLDMRALMRGRQTREGFQTAFSDGKEAAEPSCDQKRMHLHDVTNDEMLLAQEGEDPCHAGGSIDEPEWAMQPSEEHQAFAQDVLRGVIMSEILTRPCERAAMRRRRTNGY